jgi:LacI family transcriptional regulator
MAAALSPAVTVVDQDPAGLGRIAVERLLQRIEDPAAQVRRRTVLPVQLIPRGSGELPPST